MATVTQLERKLSDLKSELRTTQKRYDELNNIASGLERAVDTAVDQFNSKVKKCKNKIDEGLRTKSTGILVSAIDSKKEGRYNEDTGLYSVMSNLNKEKNRCYDDVARLKREIRQTENDLRDAKELERSNSMYGVGGTFGGGGGGSRF